MHLKMTDFMASIKDYGLDIYILQSDNVPMTQTFLVIILHFCERKKNNEISELATAFLKYFFLKCLKLWSMISVEIDDL